jgi:hypothetical protein
MSISITKLVIFTLALLLANFIMSRIIDSVTVKTTYDQETSNSVFMWTYLTIIPGIAAGIALIAAFFNKGVETFLTKMLRSFLTTIDAVYLLFALPKFFLILYKFIRDWLS